MRWWEWVLLSQCSCQFVFKRPLPLQPLCMQRQMSEDGYSILPLRQVPASDLRGSDSGLARLMSFDPPGAASAGSVSFELANVDVNNKAQRSFVPLSRVPEGDGHRSSPPMSPLLN